MARRTKSFGDITSQMARIQEGLGYSNDPVSRARYERADNAANRYSGNIARTRSQRAGNRRMQELLRQYNRTYEAMGDTRPISRQMVQTARDMSNIQYPRNVYMGLNNG